MYVLVVYLWVGWSEERVVVMKYVYFVKLESGTPYQKQSFCVTQHEKIQGVEDLNELRKDLLKSTEWDEDETIISSLNFLHEIDG